MTRNKLRKRINDSDNGLLKVRIWKRGQRVTTAVVRLYRDGDVWKESTRLGPRDVPLARHLLDLAHSWMLQAETSSEIKQ